MPPKSCAQVDCALGKSNRRRKHSKVDPFQKMEAAEISRDSRDGTKYMYFWNIRKFPQVFGSLLCL